MAKIAVAPLVGAWIEIEPHRSHPRTCNVAPLVGAWIEISPSTVIMAMTWSLPSWERGLKFASLLEVSKIKIVAPLVGAWIEISIYKLAIRVNRVAPLVGAWIEIARR